MNYRILALSMALSLTLLMGSKNDSLGQSLAEDGLHEWYDGTALTVDGEELKGKLFYESKNGLLLFDDGINSRGLTPRSVMVFEYFDHHLNKKRTFYSLEYEDREHKPKKRYFFEICKEFKNFAVLSLKDPLRSQTYSGGASSYSGSQGRSFAFEFTVNSQTELILLMEADEGTIKPFMRVTDNELDAKEWFEFEENEKKKGKLLADEDQLADYVSAPVYAELKKYAKNNKLNFRRKADLMQILNYYEELISRQ